MKYLGSIFTIILLLTVGNIYASISFTVNGISYYYRNDGDGYNYLKVYVTSVDNECTGNLEIPSSVTYMYTTYEVIRIGSNALSGCTGLTSVQIPYSVTEIGNNAFSGCTGLKSIKIPEGVTYIGSSAFEGCTGLTSIVVSNYNDVYDSRDNCNAIIQTATNTLIVGCKNTIIPNGVTSIESGAFSGLTSITIPKQITSISAGAFLDCPDLTSIIVENGNTVYDSRDNCDAIIKTATNTIVTGCKNTKIPNSVTSIASSAFSGCTGLTNITIPNSVTSIGDRAFSGCSGLTSVTIPNSVTSIGDRAFSGCSGLTSIEIPNSVTTIGSYAFSGCSGLTSIEIPNSVTTIGSYAFDGCSGLTSVTIPNSVTSIGDHAFSGCSGLTSVTIPNSVTSIGYQAFYYCTGLKEIYVKADTPPSAYSYTFSGVNTNSATLYVPVGSKDAYAAAAGWKKFTNIVEMEFTGIDEVVDEVKGENSKVKDIYDLSGRKVTNPTKGIYIVNGKKVLLK